MVTQCGQNVKGSEAQCLFTLMSALMKNSEKKKMCVNVFVLFKVNELNIVKKKPFFPSNKDYLCICSMRLKVVQGQ